MFLLLNDLTRRVRDLMIKIVCKCIYKEFLAAKIVGCVTSKSFERVFYVFFYLKLATGKLEFVSIVSFKNTTNEPLVFCWTREKDQQGPCVYEKKAVILQPQRI